MCFCLHTKKVIISRIVKETKVKHRQALEVISNYIHEKCGIETETETETATEGQKDRQQTVDMKWT